MARPIKQGLFYFPLDVDFFEDKKIKILKARYGADGVILYLYLLCEIYENGYYIEFDDDYEYIIADSLNMSVDKVKQVMKFLFERSLLDSTLFKSDTILTSKSIQKRFQEAVKEKAKKKPIEIEKFWLLNEDETQSFIKVRHFTNKSEINPNKSEINPNKSKINDTNKIKGNKIKENNNDDNIVVKNPVVVFYCNNISFTPSAMEIEKLMSYENELSEELMMRGIEIAIENNVRKLNYIEAIYKNWISKGITNIEQYKASEEARNNVKRNGGENNQNSRTSKLELKASVF